MLAVYIQYKYVYYTMYIPQPCAHRAHWHPPTDIYGWGVEGYFSKIQEKDLEGIKTDKESYIWIEMDKNW